MTGIEALVGEQTEEQLRIENEEVAAFKTRVNTNLTVSKKFLSEGHDGDIGSAIDQLEQRLAELSTSNEQRLQEVNNKFKFGQIDRGDEAVGTQLFQAVDYDQVFAEDPLEVDFKFCNRVEDEFHEANDWVLHESMLSQLKHDIVRVEECQSNSFFVQASAPGKDYINRVDKLTALVESGFTKDEECCLVCGNTDYEDENMIGFCDLCGLSVHRECYGLDVLDATTDFVCNNCLAFGSGFTLRTPCVLCGYTGGAQLPSNLEDREFHTLVSNPQNLQGPTGESLKS